MPNIIFNIPHNIVRAGKLNIVQAGQLNLVHAGQLNLVTQPIDSRNHVVHSYICAMHSIVMACYQTRTTSSVNIFVNNVVQLQYDNDMLL